MMKRTWLSLLCCLLMLCCAGCGAMAERTDAAVRVGDVVYDLQTVQSALASSRLLYETAGVSLNDEQEQQLADSVLEHFIGLGVLESLLREAGQAEFDDQTQSLLDQQAQQTYEAAWQQVAAGIRGDSPDVTDGQIDAFLADMGCTTEAYRQQLELELKNQRVLDRYCGEIALGDGEALAYYEQNYVSVCRERYEGNIPLFEQEVLVSGGVSYYVPEGYRRIKHIVMALPEDIAERLSALQSGSSAISQDAWQAMLDAAGKTMKPKTDAIYQALADGESFESQMRLYSYDTGVAPEDAGYLIHADSVLWDDGFLKAAMALEHPGDVSEPVVTTAGIHIILYAGDEPAGPLALTQEQQELLEQEALADKQTRALEELVSRYRGDYEIETHPEWLTISE
ncbi:MAG: peptidylprolyl isomerase [Candidatus Limiplasma sp.]|nr:peptidylprolyl isomerase [Candidatus Limiplasma sp.]